MAPSSRQMRAEFSLMVMTRSGLPQHHALQRRPRRDNRGRNSASSPSTQTTSRAPDQFGEQSDAPSGTWWRSETS